MATNIQHKLFHLEVPPPEEVWTEIAARLEVEFNAEEVPATQKMYNFAVPPPAAVWPEIADRLNAESNAKEVSAAQTMYNLEVPPPAAAWQHIEAALEQQPAKHEARVLHMPVLKAVSAAAAMILVTMAAWYFLNNTTDHSIANAKVVKQKAATATAGSNAGAQKQTPSASFEPEEPMADKFDGKSIASSAAVSGISDRYTSRPEGHRIAWYSDYKPIATSYAGVDDVQTVPLTNTDEPTVEAPLIRDASGKVILDKKLITSPDNCYINVTGPNGDQTRISSKFLHIISSLNADDTPDDYFDFMLQENSLWKLRFSEWKNKFLNQQIIPMATNFDILELKDILQDEN